ncbi:MAG: [Fe-Fe] hydrogenase large subunit C-terminal domain-containing protein [Oscillospiraceae bacterium]|nr:[Fe-Fe] hydrogenase large subunit C-terminal domain-containing protein [Oscillospiraceae bacterium]
MSEILRLKKSNCKNCYKCIRHCPVKSIRFSGNQAHIVSEECILCGQCFVVCPQDAKEIADSTETVRVLLAGGAPVFASVAPSFKAYYEDSCMTAMRAALRKLGFADAEETAVGATLVKREYDRILSEGSMELVISSCCNSVNLLIGKHYPQLMKYLAPVVTPMRAHCDDIKRRHPDAKTVFIGPCVSKKEEAGGASVDAVLTFAELNAMFKAAGIQLESGSDSSDESRTRLFPTVGGILKSMDCTAKGYTYLTVDGTENCKAALEDIAAGGLSRCFIEMSACAGSCIGGPIMEKYRNSPVRHYQATVNYAGAKDFDVAQPAPEMLTQRREYIGCAQVMPGEEQIREVLRRTGKFGPEDELNCGTCGYDTCREKAVAVLQGKADISMCLPYLMDKSEKFTTSILANTPNGILVVNEDLEVQQINQAAMTMLNIRAQADVLGEQVVRILDPLPFLDVLGGKEVRGRRDYFAEYGRWLDETIVCDRASHSLITILRDVTDEENARREKQELGRQTAEIADKVVDKQMRIVQEIASLLGETAAETKIALTKLKESIPHDENE